MGFAAKEFLHDFLNLRHPGHTTNQDYLIDFTGGDAGIPVVVKSPEGPPAQAFGAVAAALRDCLD